MTNIALNVARLSLLTKRELEVFQLRCEGYTERRISEELVIAERTVKNHIARIYSKLEIDTLSRDTRAPLIPQFLPYITQFINDKKHDGDIRSNEPSPEIEQNAIVTTVEENTNSDYDQRIPSTAIIAALEDELYLTQYFISEIERKEPPIIEIPPNSPKNVSYWNVSRRKKALGFAIGMLFFGILIGAGTTTFFLQHQDQVVERVITPVVSDATGIPTTSINIPSVTVPSTSTIAAPLVSNCGETVIKEYQVTPEFVPYQGVSLFRPDNTDGIVLNTKVRSLEINMNGLWAGYSPSSTNNLSGVTLYHKPQWIDCTFVSGLRDKTINDIKTDSQGRIWIGAEKAGVSMFDGTQWHTYTVDEGLPSNDVFGLGFNNDGVVFATTWEGVAMFNGTRWDEAYTVYNGTLIDNHIHAIAFDSTNSIWLGHINRGLTRFDNNVGKWIHYEPLSHTVSGVEVRDILVRPAGGTEEESVWIATADGGITEYESGTWTTYNSQNGLLSDSVTALTLDKYNRVWAAMSGGVMYFDREWKTYNTFSTLNVAIGCTGCIIDDDHVWTATIENGLTHSRIPLPVQAIDVLDVKYPKIVAPGETFRPEITVSPRAPYKLEAARGDMLINIDADISKRFGAFEHIKIKDGVTVSPGEPYTFTDYEGLFVAPELAPNETEKTFVSMWRVWMYTRYVGDPIKIKFTVKKR